MTTLHCFSMACMEKYNLKNTYHLPETLAGLCQSVSEGIHCDVSIVCMDGTVRYCSLVISAASQYLQSILLSIPSGEEYTIILDGFYKHQVETLLCRNLFYDQVKKEEIVEMLDLLQCIQINLDCVKNHENEEELENDRYIGNIDTVQNTSEDCSLDSSHHDDQDKTKTECTINETMGSRSCLLCTKIFKTKKEYNQHYQRKHVDEKQFSCKTEKCKKLFKTHFELKIHEKSHSNVKDLVCPHCKLQYKTKSTLHIHVKRKHGGKDYEEKYPCEECGNTFRLLVDLKTHISNVHKAKLRLKNTCNICSKSFSLKAHLQEHLLIHSGQKPYECDNCSAQFRTKSNLKKHLKVHTGVKDLCCIFCTKAFGRSDHLKNHVAKNHGTVQLEQSSNAACVFQF